MYKFGDLPTYRFTLSFQKPFFYRGNVCRDINFSYVDLLGYESKEIVMPLFDFDRS